MKFSSFFLAILLCMTLVSATHLSRVQVCDGTGGTTLVRDLVSVCNRPNLALPLQLYHIIPSTDLLQQTNARPYTDQVHPQNITFLYDVPSAGEPKKVRLLLTKDITTSEASLPLNAFSQNLVNGSPLMLILSNEYYLLQNTTRMDLFNTANLQLVHIPTRQMFTSQQYAGTSQYVFNVLGGRSVSVSIRDNNVVITHLEPGEVPAAYVMPRNLTSDFEVQFSLNEPVRAEMPSPFGSDLLLTMCREDNPADRQQALVCVGNNPRISLREGNLTRPYPESPVAFLYEYVGGAAGSTNQLTGETQQAIAPHKRISIFWLQTPSTTAINLKYNDFISSLIAGRRIALQFQGQLYLLQHPVSSTFSLRDFSLTAYQETGTTTLSASGSEDRIEFPTLDGGKMYIQRNYGVPPPPFQLTALTQEQLTPVNLPEQLFTSFSSTGRVTITTPNFGTITTSVNNQARYRDEFVVNIGGGAIGQGDTVLHYREPTVIPVTGNTLFYYHSAEIAGTTPIKTVSAYQFYDLSQARTHPFTDNFIATFTSGGELALKFGSSYYLLGHQGNPNQVQFYSADLLRLRRLNDSQTYPISVQNRVASFNVPEGRIQVEADTSNIANRVLRIRATTQRDITTIPFMNFMTELNATNRVEIGASTLRLCFTDVYGGLRAAQVCDDATNGIGNVIIDPDSIVPYSLILIDDKHYLLDTNGRTGNEKKVFIHQLINLHQKDNTQDDSDVWIYPNWVFFVNELVANRKPVFNISGTLLLPSATNTLLTSFTLGTYPHGQVQSLRNIRAITPITANGSIVLNDQIVLVAQKETGMEDVPVRIQLTLQPYHFLPETAVPLTLESLQSVPSSLSFVTSINGNQYGITLLPVSNNIVRIQLFTDTTNTIIIDRYFAMGETKRIRLDSVLVDIHVVEINATAARVTISRVG